MLDTEKFNRLARLSKLSFTDSERIRMLKELNIAVKTAAKVFENSGDNPQKSKIPEEFLREDKIYPSLKRDKALQNAKTCKNCFTTTKVV